MYSLTTVELFQFIEAQHADNSYQFLELLIN